MPQDETADIGRQLDEEEVMDICERAIRAPDNGKEAASRFTSFNSCSEYSLFIFFFIIFFLQQFPT